MVGNFSNRTACRIRNRRRRHDNNMTLRKKKTPRAYQHYMGWRAGQKSLVLPVAGEFFLLTLPFIEQKGHSGCDGVNAATAQRAPQRETQETSDQNEILVVGKYSDLGGKPSDHQHLKI